MRVGNAGAVPKAPVIGWTPVGVHPSPSAFGRNPRVKSPAASPERPSETGTGLPTRLHAPLCPARSNLSSVPPVPPVEVTTKACRTPSGNGNDPAQPAITATRKNACTQEINRIHTPVWRNLKAIGFQRMAHEVFISYCSEDKAVADAVCAGLEGGRVRCWIAPRDVAPGANWGRSIVHAITASKVMVVIFSGHTNRSVM
jgi:hypothetical protein